MEAHIKDFISLIYGDLKGFASIWWRRNPGQTPVDSSKWFSLPEELDDLIAFAQTLTDKDLYLPIGTFTEERRSAENAYESRVVYQDTDTMDWKKYRIEPSITVQTSKGRTHNWWLLDSVLPANDCAEISRLITVAHREDGADPSSWSSNKLLRIPGSINTSHDGFPEKVKIIQIPGTIYSAQEIRDAYADIKVDAPIAIQGNLEIPTVEDLPEYSELLEKLSKETLDLALNEPHPNADRSRMRFKLLLACLREGLTPEETASVAWHAPACRKWTQEDHRGISGLYLELAKAQAQVTHEGITPRSEQIISPLEPIDLEEISDMEPSQFHGLLTDAEREQIRGMSSFITLYTGIAATRMAKQNIPYDRINAWATLSLMMSDYGFIPRSNGPEFLNLYTCTLGDTTTGKSAARRWLFAAVNEYFSHDRGFDIGGNASSSALGRKLLERDGRVSFFNKDEAHGVLKQWMGGGKDHWTTGLVEDLAELYDGKVPPQLRTGNWEASGKGAETFFSMHLMGTPDAMIAALNRDMFLTGFLARFQWAIGLPRDIDFDSMAEKDSDKVDGSLGFDPNARQLSVGVKMIRQAIGEYVTPQHRVPVRIAPDAARRLQTAKWEMATMFTGDKNFDILEPSLVRMGVTIRKCASLLALSEGRVVSELRDVLRALEAAEEWIGNLIIISNKLSASDWQRACDDVEAYIQSRPGGVAKRSDVMRRFRAVEGQKMVMYLRSLSDQGRIKEYTDRDRKVDLIEALIKK